mgnify:CR=1 FL=1
MENVIDLTGEDDQQSFWDGACRLTYSQFSDKSPSSLSFDDILGKVRKFSVSNT